MPELSEAFWIALVGAGGIFGGKLIDVGIAWLRATVEIRRNGKSGNGQVAKSLAERNRERLLQFEKTTGEFRTETNNKLNHLIGKVNDLCSGQVEQGAILQSVVDEIEKVEERFDDHLQFHLDATKPRRRRK